MPGYQRNGYSSDQNSVSSQDDHHYEVEHLATFTISPQAGLVYPSDGMRRLLQMEKTSGIWTQKMYLRLDSSWVVIVDYENGEVVEKFPIHLIRDPTAFTSSDQKEIYDNIFVFIVGEDSATQNPPEMHIFQCVRVNATVLVEEMKGFMTGVKKGAIPPPPNAPPPEPPGPIRDQLPPFGPPPVDSRADDTSSTSSEKYERDVAVLNRCFDDIERFIARLQHAAAASRELDRRRRSRKSKKKDHGDGIMAVRARAPPEKEFVDTLQKFKLSFNLLAKLKSHIHDPNAPELVHFLFTPLALIVDASRDAQIEPMLPSRVISPLLTAEAVELLTNCLTSKETELWHSLGEAWLIPREKWKGYVTPYNPVFADGWAPDYQLLEDKERPNERYFYDSERERAAPSPSPVRRERSETPPSEFRTPNRPGSDISGDSMDRSGAEDVSERRQRLWVEELRKRDARIVQVTYPRTANNDKELTVVRGELLEVVDDTKNWWKCRNMRGQEAHVPHTIVTPYLFEDEIFQPYNHQEARPGPSTDWVKRERQDHTFDDSFSEDEDGLPTRSRPTKKAPPPRAAPSKAAPPPKAPPTKAAPPPKAPPKKPITAAPPPPPVNRKVESDSESESSAEDIPPPKRHGRKDSSTSQEMVLDELRHAVKRDIKPANIKKPPKAVLSYRSNYGEVQEFLTAKGFGSDVKRRLRNMDGKELFDMSKEDFTKLLGKDEGHRLDSYLTIQKNITSYKTVRTSELKLALLRARVRSGVSRSPSPEKKPKPLPVPKKLFEYESGHTSSPPASPVAEKKEVRRQPSESPPPARKSYKAPPMAPPKRREPSESPPPARKPYKAPPMASPPKRREPSESPPPARKSYKAPPAAPPPKRREPSESPPVQRKKSNGRRDQSDSPPRNRANRRVPSESPPRKPKQRVERESPPRVRKTSPTKKKNPSKGVSQKQRDEYKKPPPDFDDQDSDDEPPAPGTLREQILKQRKRLSNWK